MYLCVTVKGILNIATSSTDPRFFIRVDPTLDLDKNLLFGKIFAGNCMKMKQNGPRGVCISIAPLDPLRWINSSAASENFFWCQFHTPIFSEI